MLAPGLLFNPRTYKLIVQPKGPCGGCGQPHPGETAMCNDYSGFAPILSKYFPGGISDCRTDQTCDANGEVVAVKIESDNAVATIVCLPLVHVMATMLHDQLHGV